MVPEDIDQDKLAEEWASALSDEGDEGAVDPFESAMAAMDDAGENDAGASAGGGLADEWASALADQEETAIKKEKEQNYLSSKSHPVEFKDLTHEAKTPRHEGTKRDLDFILDIPLEVSAELGRTKLLINELLQLGQGSVVELNKLAGEPLEIYVNGKLVARGEAVVINEKFGIRLTDIISPIERVKQLG